MCLLVGMLPRVGDTNLLSASGVSSTGEGGSRGVDPTLGQYLRRQREAKEAREAVLAAPGAKVHVLAESSDSSSGGDYEPCRYVGHARRDVALLGGGQGFSGA